MKTVAFSLQKGGVGKTSLSGAVAFELAQRGRTILVDVDPQGSASSWHVPAGTKPKHELADVLYGKVTAAEGITHTACPTLDLLPTFGLDGDLKLYGENQLSNEPYIFEDLAGELQKLGYEFCVLDLSPAFGRLERSALIAAEEVITPTAGDWFSLDGLEIFGNELRKLIKAMRKGPVHKRIVVNAYDGRIGQNREIYTAMQGAYQAHTVYLVPVDPAFRKAQSRNLPVQMLPKELAAKPETLEAIKRLGEEI